MEYIGNRPPPPNPYQYDDYPWWNYNPYGNFGGYDPYGNPVTSWQDQIAQSGGEAPQQPPPAETPNEGQVVETPEGTGPSSFVPGSGNPNYTTEVVANPDRDEYLGYQPNYNIGDYLSNLPGGYGGGGSGFYPSGGGNPTFSTDVIGFSDPSYPFPGPYDVEDYDPNPPPGTPTFKTDVWDTTDPDDPLSPDKKKIKTYWDFPQELPPNPPLKYPEWPEFKFTPNPPPGTKIPPVGPTIKIPPFPQKPPPPKTQTGGGGTGGGGQQQQKPGVGGLLAALPLLAAFQGGTTTTPAPYAHLGPHTPVKPVFGPQAPGKPIPSIGQLLAGVR